MGTDVLIIGAGPAGLTMAAELARYGVNVRIVEKAPRPPEHPHALLLWSRTLELLDRTGAGESFVSAGHKIFAASINAAGRSIGRIDFAAVNSTHPYVLMLPQTETERLLETYLNSLGVYVERGVELALFNDSAPSIAAVLRHPNGRLEMTEAKWLIGCDGARSTVREAAGLSFSGRTTQSDWALADVHINGGHFSQSELQNYWSEDGFLAILPAGRGRCRIIADVSASSSGTLETPTLAQIQGYLDKRGPGGIQVSDAAWLSGFRVQERNLKDYRSGHVFLVGDAAHILNPAGAQGMNMGMQDAFNLAWKLALVCRGLPEERLLASYTAERRAVTEQVLANVSRLTSVSLMKNTAGQTMRNLAGELLLGLAPARRVVADTMSEVSLGYEHSPLVGPADNSFPVAVPGERMPPVKGQAPVGAGHAPRFALFAAPSNATARLIDQFRDLLEPEVRPPLSPSCMWLVRPDGYVADVGLDPDIETFAHYLDRLRR